jgi:TonB family protein
MLLAAIAGIAVAVPPPPPPPPPPTPPSPPAPVSTAGFLARHCGAAALVAASAAEYEAFKARNTDDTLLDAARKAATGPATVNDIQGLSPVRPNYPVALLGTGLHGQVKLELRVTETGEVQDAIALCSPHAEFSRAAIEAARASRFTPQRVNDIAVPTFVFLPFNF